MLSLKSSTSPHSAARNALGEKLCFKFINDSSSCYRNATAARQCLETRVPFMFTVRGAGCWGYLTMEGLVHPIPSLQRPHKPRACHTTMLGWSNHWAYLQCTDLENTALGFLQIPGGHCSHNQLFKKGIKRILLGKQNRIFLKQASAPPTASELGACAKFFFNFSRTVECSVRHLGWDLKGFHAPSYLKASRPSVRNNSRDEQATYAHLTDI